MRLVCVCVCVCIDRGILARDLIPLDMSRKEADGANKPVSFTKDLGWREHERRPYSNNLTGASINQQGSFGRVEKADRSSVAWLGPHECLNMEISCI